MFVCFSVRRDSLSQFSAVSQTDTSSYGESDVFGDVKASVLLGLFNSSVCVCYRGMVM